MATAPPARPVVTRPPPPKPGSSPSSAAGVTHVTATSVTSAAPTVPLAFATLHTWMGSIGWVATRTSYSVPLGNG